MSIKAWWQNLGKQPERFSSVDYHKCELKSAKAVYGEKYWKTEYHEAKLQESYKEENEQLRKQLAVAYKERLTPTSTDFQQQLLQFSEACKALAHQKLLGVSQESEISRIILRNWQDAMAKLMFLCFDDKVLPLEVVEQKIAEYREKIAAEGQP